MSHYVWESNVSYADYLQAKSLLSDVTNASQAIQHEVYQQTREIIASKEQLEEANIEIRQELSAGFERLSWQLESISSGIDELNATFHWGFSHVIGEIGRISDSVQELISIAKTPAQTWAYNQYEIARDAMRMRLYADALESLDRSINGFGDNTGYILEYRFHYSKGLIHLGEVDGYDAELIDLPTAETAFLSAARYAKTDHPLEAGRAFLCAGWAAYCQGKMNDAKAHTEQAIAIHPELVEALFQLAKIQMHIDEPESGIHALSAAIAIDHRYSLKAASNGDFQRYGNHVDELLKQLTEQARQPAEQAIAEAEASVQQISKVAGNS